MRANRSRHILFVHDNFPAQFGQFGRWLLSRGWQVTFATARRDARAGDFAILPYAPHRAPTDGVHPYARPFESAAIAAQGFARAALRARAGGLRPDVVMAHAGWGAGMFAREIFPEAVSVPLMEWFYRTPAPDAEATRSAVARPPPPADGPMLQAARNAPLLMDLAGSDAAICPTPFQAAQFPPRLRALLTVLHDGIDTDRLRPDPAAAADTLGGRVPPEAPVVTYATRGMEPHRGFPAFIRALPAVLAAHPAAHVVIAGENRVAYGDGPLRAADWKARMLAEVPLDPARVHFTGLLPPAAYLRLLQRSSVHVYLTVPFVLSWSMLEAMAVGCLLVASDCAPVRDFAADGESALLVDHDDTAALTARIVAALAAPDAHAALRKTAREAVLRQCAARVVFPRKLALVEALLAARG